MRINRAKQRENILMLLTCVGVPVAMIMYIKYLPELAVISAALLGW